jgi:hypothetical protein
MDLARTGGEEEAAASPRISPATEGRKREHQRMRGQQQR